MASGLLLLRQEWLELTEAKGTNQTSLLLSKSHNETYNPSGKPLEAADRRRTTSNANLPSAPGHKAQSCLQTEKHTTIWELAQQYGTLVTLSCQGQTLLFANAGHLWVWGR